MTFDHYRRQFLNAVGSSLEDVLRPHEQEPNSAETGRTHNERGN